MPGQTSSHETVNINIKRRLVLEKMLWLSPSHCFSEHTWLSCNISPEVSARACNWIFRLIWIDKSNFLLLFPFKCRILFYLKYSRFPSNSHGIIEAWNGLGWKGSSKDHLVPTPLPWARTPSTRPGCSKPRLTWPSTLAVRGHPQLLWATCSSASPASWWRISSCI